MSARIMCDAPGCEAERRDLPIAFGDSPWVRITVDDGFAVREFDGCSARHALRAAASAFGMFTGPAEASS